jgi:hypothetical protein
MMVTSVGQAILQGKHLCEGGVTPKDWLHFTIALLCHDIGYARGVCRADRNDMIATGIEDSVVMLSNSGTDAALTPYHIDRSKLFVRERFGRNLLVEVNTDIITSYIEITRSPHPNTEFYKDTRGLPGLLRAADYIGQLGDPNYLRKIPALFYEFEEQARIRKPDLQPRETCVKIMRNFIGMLSARIFKMPCIIYMSRMKANNGLPIYTHMSLTLNILT